MILSLFYLQIKFYSNIIKKKIKINYFGQLHHHVFEISLLFNRSLLADIDLAKLASSLERIN